MLRIKLSRVGRRGQPYYRIIIAEKRSKRDGEAIAQVGFYSTLGKTKEVRFDVAEYQRWLTQGAQPTDTVAALFKKFQSTQA